MCVLERAAHLVLIIAEAVDELSQAIGRRNDGAFQGRSDRVGDLVETSIDLGSALDKLLVHDDAKVIRGLNRVADAGFALVDKLDEFLAASTAENLVCDSDLSIGVVTGPL
ncbi:hypothetical protein LW14_15915, partial [Rhizobium sp. H41]